MSKPWLCSLPLVLLAAGCASGSWRVSDDVRDLARETRPGGMFVIELDEDGAVVNADTQVDMARVPKVVLEAAERDTPGPAVDAEAEVALGERTWEIEKKVDGRTIEIIVDDAGKVVGKEEELPSSKWPAHVVEAANRAVPDGRVTTVEFIWGPEALGGREYHVKKDVGGEVIRISVLEDGRIGRVVRKIRAEVKVPR